MASNKETVAVRLETELIRLLEEVKAERLQKEPWLSLNRSDLIREAVFFYLKSKGKSP